MEATESVLVRVIAGATVVLGAGLPILFGGPARVGTASAMPIESASSAVVASARSEAPRGERRPASIAADLGGDADPDEALADDRFVSGASGAFEPERATEAEFRERWRALELRSPGAIARDAAVVLRGDGPDAEKVALLRVARELDVDGWDVLFDTAIRLLPAAPDPVGWESVASTALALLERAAPDDPLARETLLRVAFDVPRCSSAFRTRAAAAYFLNASDVELAGASFHLDGESDALVLLAAQEASTRNPHVPRSTAIR